eukprot:3924374-Amphidinium_carterae.1
MHPIDLVAVGVGGSCSLTRVAAKHLDGEQMASDTCSERVPAAQLSLTPLQYAGCSRRVCVGELRTQAQGVGQSQIVERDRHFDVLGAVVSLLEPQRPLQADHLLTFCRPSWAFPKSMP